MPFIDSVSGNTTNKANIDSNYNLQINLPLSGNKYGINTISVELDAGLNTGNRIVTTLDNSWDSRLRVGIDSFLFNDRFVGTGQNTSLYDVETSNMTISQSNGFLTLNSNSNTASGSFAKYVTQRNFPIIPIFGLKFNCYAKFSQLPLSGNISEWGFGYVSDSTKPTDGAFFRYSGSSLYAINSYSGTEISSSGLSSSLIGTNLTRRFQIDLRAGTTIFKIDDNIIAINNLVSGSAVISGNPVGTQTAIYSPQVPAFFRTYNFPSGSSAAQQMSISSISITQQDANNSNPYPNSNAGMGAIASQSQNGQAISGSTARYINNSSPLGGIGSNTAAVLGSGLGGQFIWSGTIDRGDTDYIISSYQVPSGTDITPGKVLYIHGINISAINLSGSTSNVPVTALMNIAYGHTSESLATAESSTFTTATAKAPRFVPLGTLFVPSGSPAGYGSRPIVLPLTAPIVVNPSEYFATSAKFISGSGLNNVEQFNIGIDGYWE